MNQVAASRQRPPQRGPALAGKEMNSRPGLTANVDFVKVAWQSRYLLILGTLIGLGCGYFNFSRSPEIFRSAAQVQIVESMTRNLPVDAIDSGLKSRNFSDEALVMRSEQILRRAAELGELSTTIEYSGMAPEQIAAALGGGSLQIGPAIADASTSVYSIQFDSTSATTSQRVVQSVVDAYAAHLKDQYRNVGQETIDLIQQARNEVLTKLDKLEASFSDFKKQSGLIYRGSETTSLHRDHADRYMAQRQELMIQKARYTGVILSAEQAIRDQRPLESILMALTSVTTVPREDLQARAMSPEKSWELEKIRNKPLLSAADQMRQSMLLPLQLEKETLIDTVGADHPAIATINNRIAMIEKTIANLDVNEQKLRKDVDEAMKAAASEASEGRPDSVDPQERILERIKFAASAIKQQNEALDAELKLLSDSYDEEMEMAREENAAEIESSQLVREMERQQKLYDRIVARLDEVNLMTGGDGLKVFPLNTAKSGYQVAPLLAKSLLMGGFLGCMLAAGLALLRELSDRSYHSARDIAEHTRLPIIGHVPVLKSHKIVAGEPGEKLDPRLVTFFNGKGQRAEAFRAIRTAIYFSNQSGDYQVLQVTSSTPSDGKTTIAANIAVAIAQSGRKVLLMDADLRRPRIAKVMGIENEKGCAWAIQQCENAEQSATSEQAIQLIVGEAINSTEIANLSVMGAGAKPDNPSELLSSPAFDKLLTLLRGKFDMIIVDTPPLLAVSDPSNLASRVDGVMMVVRLRKNIKPAVAQATRMLETLEANVLGIIVNGVGSRAARGYGRESNAEGDYNYGASYQYGYGYSYGYTYGYTDNNKYNKYYEEEKAGKRGKKKRDTKKLATAKTESTAAEPT